MAQRDRLAGHAFMYVDIRQLLQQKQTVAKEEAAAKPVTTAPHNTIQFPKQETPPSAENREVAVKKIRENLDRLQSLHHRLHAMLQEINRSGSDDPEKS